MEKRKKNQLKFYCIWKWFFELKLNEIYRHYVAHCRFGTFWLTKASVFLKGSWKIIRYLPFTFGTLMYTYVNESGTCNWPLIITTSPILRLFSRKIEMKCFSTDIITWGFEKSSICGIYSVFDPFFLCKTYTGWVFDL